MEIHYAPGVTRTFLNVDVHSLAHVSESFVSGDWGWEKLNCVAGTEFFKQLLSEVFCDIQSYQGRGKGYQPKPKAEADNTYRDLDNSEYHEKLNSITVLLYILKLIIYTETDYIYWNWLYILKVSNKMQNSNEGHSTSKCFLTLCWQSPLFGFYLRYSRNTCLNCRWPFSVLTILIFYKCFNFRPINRANRNTVDRAVWAMRPRNTHDKISRIICSSRNGDWDLNV